MGLILARLNTLPIGCHAPDAISSRTIRYCIYEIKYLASGYLRLSNGQRTRPVRRRVTRTQLWGQRAESTRSVRGRRTPARTRQSAAAQPTRRPTEKSPCGNRFAQEKWRNRRRETDREHQPPASAFPRLAGRR